MKEHSILGCGVYYDGRHDVIISWFDHREPWLVRHEVFHGPNRQTSIRYGLYVFLPPKAHNMSEYAVHFNRYFEEYLQATSQKRAMEHYGWTLEDWMRVIGRNYF